MRFGSVDRSAMKWAVVVILVVAAAESSTGFGGKSCKVPSIQPYVFSRYWLLLVAIRIDMGNRGPMGEKL